MGGKAVMRALNVRVRLPVELLERAEADAARCGLSVQQLVGQVTHSALAERLCPHRGAAPVAPAPDADPADDGED
jgi:hypothetical protein